MSGAYRRGLRRVAGDIRSGRHIEGYSLGLVAVGLTVFNLVEPSSKVTNSIVLACLAFLIFWTTGEGRAGNAAGGAQASLHTVLRDRDSFGTFDQLLASASELCFYAPTGVNVLLRHASDIKGWVAAGGRARIVVQDPKSEMVDAVREQLDTDTDFDSSLHAVLQTLSRITSAEGIKLRLLRFSPGFSLVILNPQSKTGRLIVEFHGFRDENIADRMHIEIPRAASPHWFGYWSSRFDAIWNAAREPDAADAGETVKATTDATGA